MCDRVSCEVFSLFRYFVRYKASITLILRIYHTPTVLKQILPQKDVLEN